MSPNRPRSNTNHNGRRALRTELASARQLSHVSDAVVAGYLRDISAPRRRGVSARGDRVPSPADEPEVEAA